MAPFNNLSCAYVTESHTVVSEVVKVLGVADSRDCVKENTADACERVALNVKDFK